ncbi:MAG: glutathione S-transferase family protein [Pseudomonadota bacterium]
MIYLHHYDASLFSEKVRVMLGFLALDWHSVQISSVMPRPLLMPLSGGYRRTPVLQIGANVYCDTAIIARGLARHAADNRLFAAGFAGNRVAEWADSQLFRVAVALNFRPEALAAMMGSLSPTEIAAFQKDRAELSEGATLTTYGAPAAFAFLRAYLDDLEATLGTTQTPFLFGEYPTIADFAVYHCLWFLRNNPVNQALVSDHPAVKDWYERMAAWGHGNVEIATGEDALAAARGAEPVVPALVGVPPAGVAIGQAVRVTPVDYGRIPVTGTLVAANSEELAIARETPETGPCITHFPSAGFEVVPLD